MLCGTGRRVINPEVGHHLAGYGPFYANTGVHDDIVVTALLLDDGQTQAVLLAYDLIGIRLPLNLRIRQEVAVALGLTADQVFLHTTHVHSGPETRDLFLEEGPIEAFIPAYADRLVEWSVAAARDAKANLEPCTLHYNYTQAAENMNRRYLFPDRRWMYIPDNKQLAGLSDQFVDRELGIIAFRREGGHNSYKAVLTNYTAHPLCIGNSSNLVSADYQGALRRTVEETFAGCMCLATTGAAGDNHPLMPESGFQKAQQMGTNLGMLTVNRVYDSVQVNYDLQLRTCFKSIRLRFKDAATAALLPRREEQTLPNAVKKGLREHETFVGLLGIGPLLLVATPGEMVAELGAMMKWSSPFLRTYVLFQATDSSGYMCHRNSLCWGGYEPTNSPWAAGEGERLVQVAVQAANELLQQKPIAWPVT
jgi:hypothetical protein